MATPQRNQAPRSRQVDKKSRDYFCGTDWFVACNEMNKMSAIFTIREYTSILKRGAIYGCNFANYVCRLASNKQLRCSSDKCIIILKSVQHHESLHECKVAISKATLHFRKVTKDFKQKRVDDGNEKVKQQRVGLRTKNDNFARAIKLNCTTTT